MAFVQLHIHSKVLGMDEDVWAFIPERKAIDGSGKKFKTFWFLHGGSGHHSSGALTMDMGDFAAKYNMAVIMPMVHGSCYTDMNMGQKFCTYMGEELPLILRSMFPFLSDKREDNIISGFSNGGYGTFHVALAYPDVFGYGGAFAAGDKADGDFTYRPLEKQVLFGEGDLQQTKYSLKYQARTLAQKGGELPKFFHVCGDSDPWLKMNHLVRDCFESLSGNPFCYEYFEVPGRAHDRLCWQIALEKFSAEYLKLEAIDGVRW